MLLFRNYERRLENVDNFGKGATVLDAGSNHLNILERLEKSFSSAVLIISKVLISFSSSFIQNGAHALRKFTSDTIKTPSVKFVSTRSITHSVKSLSVVVSKTVITGIWKINMFL